MSHAGLLPFVELHNLAVGGDFVCAEQDEL